MAKEKDLSLKLKYKELDELTDIKNTLQKIWVITAQDEGEEPVVTVFNNENSAKYLYAYFTERYDKCYFDQTVLHERILVF